MKRSTSRFAINILLALAPALALSCTQAQATTIQGLAPEVQSTVWLEEQNEMASVSLNGKDLVTFHAEAGSGQAAAKAEELAVRLQELLDDKKFDANDILPSKNGLHAIIQRDGSTVVSFDPTADAGDEQASPLESSWKLVNVVRAAFGAPALPSSYLKLVEQAEQKLASDGTVQGNCFSGQASWYGGKFHGRKTSDGHRYDQEKLTAAHRSLPFGTKLLVMNRKTGTSCVVEVNDRGPFVADRVIDLSRAAARQLNMLSTGVALVDCLVLGVQQ